MTDIKKIRALEELADWTRTEYANVAASRMRDAMEALDRLAAQVGEWQPIETAPKDQEVEVRGIWKLRGDGVAFTRWRPLPPPPETTDE